MYKNYVCCYGYYCSNIRGQRPCFRQVVYQYLVLLTVQSIALEAEVAIAIVILGLHKKKYKCQPAISKDVETKMITDLFKDFQHAYSY